MISRNFDILTPMSKIHRISRTIWKRATFKADPGVWAVLVKDTATGYVEGSITTADDTTNSSGVFVLCINYAIPSTQPVSTYEANDTKIGRIAVIEEPGVRCQVARGLFVTGEDPHVGDKLTVSTATASAGLLKVATAGDTVVCRVEALMGSDVEIKTIDQVTI